MREVLSVDAVEWLKNQPVLDGASLVASLPDYSEFPTLTLAQWSEWFTDVAELILRKTPSEGVSIFFQSDIKQEGTWIDKSYLVQKAAEREGSALLWHKILCRTAPGSTTHGRPSYSHLLCFSRGVRADIARATPDVIPDQGEKSWARGMGIHACQHAVRFIQENTSSTRVVNPFCGMGSVLAVANEAGLPALGIERSLKRAQSARELKVARAGMGWESANPEALKAP